MKKGGYKSRGCYNANADAEDVVAMSIMGVEDVVAMSIMGVEDVVAMSIMGVDDVAVCAVALCAADFYTAMCLSSESYCECCSIECCCL